MVNDLSRGLGAPPWRRYDRRRFSEPRSAPFAAPIRLARFERRPGLVRHRRKLAGDANGDRPGGDALRRRLRLRAEAGTAAIAAGRTTAASPARCSASPRKTPRVATRSPPAASPRLCRRAPIASPTRRTSRSWRRWRSCSASTASSATTPIRAERPRLVAPDGVDAARLEAIARAVAFGRDLVNTPANDLGPAALEREAARLAEEFGAAFEATRGDDLLERNLPLIHAVGRAAAEPPRLVDFRWGREDAPKVTLVGKGVVFDSGGLDIKPSSGMQLMKKDMGGAAAALALARLVMETRPRRPPARADPDRRERDLRRGDAPRRRPRAAARASLSRSATPTPRGG